VRAVIEAESAALAALNMTPEGIALLEETVRVMSGNDEAAEAADERFHILIAENSGSPIIEHFVRILWRMRNEAPQVAQVYGNVCKSGFEDRVEEHGAVLDAIRNRDPNAARLAMREHFSRLFEAMLAAEETEAIVQLRRKALEHRHRFKLSVQTASPDARIGRTGIAAQETAGGRQTLARGGLEHFEFQRLNARPTPIKAI
jgi:hypothetical protein